MKAMNRFVVVLLVLALALGICAQCGAASQPTYFKGVVVGSVGLTGPGAKFYASVPLTATANATTYSGVFAVSRAMTITKATVSFVAKPSSAAGTVTLALTNYDLSATTDDNLLSTATVDLEAAWLTAKNACNLTLTTTAADKVLAAGDFVYATIASNNVDMTGGTGGVLTIEYTLQ